MLIKSTMTEKNEMNKITDKRRSMLSPAETEPRTGKNDAIMILK